MSASFPIRASQRSSIAVGWIESVAGTYPNPESRAYGGSGLPKQPLYRVGFRQSDIWKPYSAGSSDSIYVDIYQHWLEKS